MNSVVFAYRESELPPGPNLSGRPEIFEKLQDRDLDPVVSLLAESAFVGADIRVHDLVLGDKETAGAEMLRPLDEMGLIVNRIGRSIKLDKLPADTVLPPMINENKTRSLAHRKHRTHDEILDPLGIGIPTRLVNSVADVESFVVEHESADYIVKPDGGSESKGIQKLGRDAVTGLFGEQPELLGKNVIQPAYDFTNPFPRRLRPFDADSAEAFEGWSTSDAVKELRVYGLHSPAGTAVFPTARAIKEGDQWFFVDPESLPESLLAVTRQAIAAAAGLTEAKALLGTVDFGYGGLPGAAPSWHAIEMNAKQPYMIGYDKHPIVADELRNLFAEQIHATVMDKETS